MLRGIISLIGAIGKRRTLVLLVLDEREVAEGDSFHDRQTMEVGRTEALLSL